jgi:site-specific DNA-methyltransferase (adenine-specific)
VYDALDGEFDFTLDPCPLDASAIAGAPLWGKCGLSIPWDGQRVFCNPPYSNITPWLEKSWEPTLAVYLLPVKSDVGWWHDHVMRAAEVRFVLGRIRFVGMSGGAPFPSAVVVFRGGRGPAGLTPVWRSWPRPARARTLATARNGPEGT